MVISMRPFDSLTGMQMLWAFISIIGFSINTNLKGWKIIFTGIGGALAWGSYLVILYYSSSLLLSVFLATVLVYFYSEIVARLFRIPVSVFVICAIIPLVPGSTLYYSMSAYIMGKTMQASRLFGQTVLISGTISMAIAVMSSISNLYKKVIRRF